MATHQRPKFFSKSDQEIATATSDGALSPHLADHELKTSVSFTRNDETLTCDLSSV